MSSSPFPDYPDQCGWTALLPPRTPRPPATGQIAVKYAVVGAGYTGLAAILMLLVVGWQVKSCRGQAHVEPIKAKVKPKR